MKPAVIFWIPTPTPTGYSWKWRADNGKSDSVAHFSYYHDCLADAQAEGYAVERVVARGNTAPGWRSLMADSAFLSRSGA
jgi:hypothetical protein